MILFVLLAYITHLFATPSSACWSVPVENGGAVIKNQNTGKTWRYTWRNGATLYGMEGRACIPTSLSENLMCETNSENRVEDPSLYCLSISRALLVVFTQLSVLLVLDLFHSFALSRMYDRTLTLVNLVPPYFTFTALTSILIVNQSIASSWSNFWGKNGWPQPSSPYDHSWINWVIVVALVVVVFQWAMLWAAFQRHNNGVPRIQYSGRKATRSD